MRRQFVACFDVQRADAVPTGAPGDAGARAHRHGLAAAQANLAAEEKDRHLGRRPAASALADRGAAELEDPFALEEEITLLRKEQAEAGEIDLLRVFLDLRE